MSAEERYRAALEEIANGRARDAFGEPRACEWCRVYGPDHHGWCPTRIAAEALAAEGEEE